MTKELTRCRKFSSLLVLLFGESDFKFHQVAGSLVVSNSLNLRGKNAFSKVLITLGLEKNPMTLAVSEPIL